MRGGIRTGGKDNLMSEGRVRERCEIEKDRRKGEIEIK